MHRARVIHKYLSEKHWRLLGYLLPILTISIGACISEAVQETAEERAAQQELSGRDVPASTEALEPNKQRTAFSFGTIAVSPDGAFAIHSGGKGPLNQICSFTNQVDMASDPTGDEDVESSTCWTLRPLAFLDDPNLGDVASGLDLDKLLKDPMPITAQRENIALNHEGATLGGLSAISFDPHYGLGVKRISGLDCTAGVNLAGSKDCYRMLVYAQERTDKIPGEIQHVYIVAAPFELIMNRATRKIVSAKFTDKFRPITNASTGLNIDIRQAVKICANAQDTNCVSVELQFSDHFTATADGRLLVFNSQTPDYTYSPDPLYDGFLAPASFWNIQNGDAAVRAAYPVARRAFQFANGVSISPNQTGCGYPWITPDGTDLFCNAGDISALAMIGQHTDYRLRQIDGQVQTTQQRFCRSALVEPNSADVSCAADPNVTQCSPRGPDAGGCATKTRLGTQRIMMLGASSGPWASKTRWAGHSSVLPILRRTPSLLMLSRNTALSTFAESSERNDRMVYFEVATDDAVDPNFMAFLHMNEAIMPYDNGTNTWKDTLPFADATCSGSTRAKTTADTSGNGYVGTLNSPAKFPFQRNNCTEGWTNASPNPGFLGRAVYFNVPNATVRLAAPTATTSNPLIDAHDRLTLELAVKFSIWPTESTSGSSRKIVLVGAHQGFKLAIHPGSAPAPNSTTDPADATIFFEVNGVTASFAAVAMSKRSYSHLAITYKAENANNATITLYVDGVAKQTQTMTFGGSTTSTIPTRASTTEPLCIGPGCAISTSTNPATGTVGFSSGELLIDEVAVSSIVRDAEYIAVAALAKSPSDEFSALSATAATNLLNNVPLGLDLEEVRIPNLILNQLQGATDPRDRFNRMSALGKTLFASNVLTIGAGGCNDREPGISCTKCHDPDRYFAMPGQRFAKRIDDSSADLEVNTPSLLGRAFSTRQLHDRSQPSLVRQAETVIANPQEMGGDLTTIVSCLNRLSNPESPPIAVPPNSVTNYRQWFNYAFADDATLGNPVTNNQLLGALVAYELTIISGSSDVDLMTAGTSITNPQKAKIETGFGLFHGKARCAGCHSGANFTDELRHVTRTAGPVVKTPTLREVFCTKPYFHDGVKPDLPSVVEHYNHCGAMDANGAVDQNGTCAPELVPLGLTVAEIDALVTFLKGLSAASTCVPQ